MHQSLHLRPQLALLVALLAMAVCGIGSCSAKSVTFPCTSAEVMRGESSAKPATVVLKSVPSAGHDDQSQEYIAIHTEKWEPIRIVVSTKDLEDKEKYCQYMWEEKPTLLGRKISCIRDEDRLTHEKNDMLTAALPAAIKLHTDRLLVQPLNGPLKVPAFPTGSVCSEFKVPNDHRTKGVANADMVLYVGAAHGGVWGLPCATLENGRPVVGAINISPTILIHLRLATRTIAHEIAHALGFTHQNMVNHSMVKNVTGLRGRKLSVVVSSRNTAMAAREHYDCGSIDGMELQDSDGDGVRVEAHWSQRNAKDELMAPIGGAGYYTELTLGAFADLGYIKVNWQMAEPMSWGKKSGCDLLQKKCANLDISKYPKMFCNYNSTSLMCTSDRYFSGTCRSLVEELADGLYDFCSIVDASIGKMPVEYPSNHYKKERRNPKRKISWRNIKTPWCLDVHVQPPNGEGEEEQEDEEEPNAAVYAMVWCVNGEARLQTGGSSLWDACTPGERILGRMDPYRDGKVICPESAEVCTISNNGSSLLPVVAWDGKEKVWKEHVPAPDAPAEVPPGREEISNSEQPPGSEPTETTTTTTTTTSAPTGVDGAGGGGSGEHQPEKSKPQEEDETERVDSSPPVTDEAVAPDASSTDNVAKHNSTSDGVMTEGPIIPGDTVKPPVWRGDDTVTAGRLCPLLFLAAAAVIII